MTKPHLVSEQYELGAGPAGMESALSDADCPDGEVAISGGYRLSPGMVARMNTSGGSDVDDWRVVAYRSIDSATTDTFTVFAVCAAIGA